MARAGPKEKAKTKKLAPDEQHARFVKAAQDVGADENPDALDRVFKKLNPRVATKNAPKTT